MSKDTWALTFQHFLTAYSDFDGAFDIHDRPSWSHMRALNWVLQVSSSS